MFENILILAQDFNIITGNLKANNLSIESQTVLINGAINAKELSLNLLSKRETKMNINTCGDINITKSFIIKGEQTVINRGNVIVQQIMKCQVIKNYNSASFIKCKINIESIINNGIMKIESAECYFSTVLNEGPLSLNLSSLKTNQLKNSSDQLKITESKVYVTNQGANLSPCFINEAYGYLQSSNNTEFYIHQFINHGKSQFLKTKLEVKDVQNKAGHIRIFENSSAFIGSYKNQGVSHFSQSQMDCSDVENIKHMLLDKMKYIFIKRICNHGQLTMCNCQMECGKLINNRDWVDENGTYKMEEFLNCGTFALLKKKWQISFVPQKTKFDTSRFESQKTFNNDKGVIEFDNDVQFFNSQGHAFGKVKNIKCTKRIAITCQEPISLGDLSNQLDFKTINCKDELQIVMENLEITSDFELEKSIHFEVHNSIKINSNWKHIGDLKLLSHGNFIIGQSNDHMSVLEVHGNLDIVAEHIDCRFGKILCSRELDISAESLCIGSKGAPKNLDSLIRGLSNDYQSNDYELRNHVALNFKPLQPILNVLNQNQLGHYSYKNGAFISSESILNIQSNNNILIECGEIFSKQKMSISSKNGLILSSGSILSLDDIEIKCSTMKLDRFQCDALRLVGAEFWSQFNFPMTLNTSEPSTIQSLKSIKILTQSAAIEGSQILSGNNLIINDEKYQSSNMVLKVSPKRFIYPQQTYQEYNPYQRRQTTMKVNNPPDQPSLIVSGKMVQIQSSSNITIQGQVNSPIITITCNNFQAIGPNSQLNQQSVAQTIIIDLKAFGDNAFTNSSICAHERRKMIMDDDQMYSENKVSIIQQGGLIRLDQFKCSVDPNALDFYIQRALAEYTGCLSYGGLSGIELRQQMLYYAKSLNPKQQYSSLEEFAQNLQGPAIAFLVGQLKAQLSGNLQLQALSPYMVIPKECSKYWAQYQGITANQLAIRAENDVVLQHNKIRVIANKDDPKEVVLYIEAGGSITRSSKVERLKIGFDGWEGYEDRLMQKNEIIVEDGKGTASLVAFKRGIHNQNATKTYVHHGDFNMTAYNNDIKIQATRLEKYMEKQVSSGGFLFGKTTTTMKIATTNYIPDEIIVPKGDVNLQTIQGSQVHQANIIKGENIKFLAAKNVHFQAVVNEEFKSIDVAKSGMFGSSQKHQSENHQKSLGVLFQATEEITIATPDVVSFTNVLMKAQQITVQAKAIELIQGYEATQRQYFYQSSSVIWNSVCQTVEEQLKFSANKFEGKLQMKADSFYIQKVKDIVIPYLEQLKEENKSAKFKKEELEEVSKIESLSKSGPGIGLLCLIALPVGFYSAKLAMSWAKVFQIQNSFCLAAFKASIVTVSKTFAIGLVAHKGNPFKALEAVASLESVKGIIFQVASDFLSTKFAKFFNIKSLADNPQAFVDHLKANVLNQSMNMVLNIAINGEKPLDALEHSLKGVITGTIGSFLAFQIGQYYYDRKMSYEMHKLAHASLGAITGALFSKTPLSDALAGALGSLAVVTYMEALMSTDEDLLKLKSLDLASAEKSVRQRLLEKIEENMKQYQLEAEIVATLTTMIFGLDTRLAIQAAQQAVQHNCLQILAIVQVAFTIYDLIQLVTAVLKAFKKDRWEGVFRELGIHFTVKAGVKYIANRTVGPLFDVLESFGLKPGMIIKSSYEELWKRCIKKSPVLQKIDIAIAKFTTFIEKEGLKNLVFGKKGLEDKIDSMIQDELLSKPQQYIRGVAEKVFSKPKEEEICLKNPSQKWVYANQGGQKVRLDVIPYENCDCSKCTSQKLRD